MANQNYTTSVWNPWHELNDVADGLNQLFGFLPDFAPKFDYPPVNVWKGENEIRLYIKLPGVKAEEIEVNINHDTLTIKGERKPEPIAENARSIRNERISGSFKRSFALPFPVENADVEAAYKDGILAIRLPKAKAMQPRKISVQTI